MDSVRNFYLQAYLSYRGLFHWLTPFPYFSNLVLAPFLMLLNFVLIGRFAEVGNVDRFGIGMIVYAIVWIYVAGITQSFSNDRSGGTLHLLFASPANRASAYFARGAGHFYNGPVAAISTTLLAVLVIDLNAGDLNYLTYAVAIAVVSTGILMFSLLLGNFAALYRDWQIFFSVALGALLGLTGVIIPVDRLPGVLEGVAQALPITHGLRALRGAFAGDSVAAVSSDLLLELAVAGGYAVLGLVVFVLIDRAARRRGILAGGDE